MRVLFNAGIVLCVLVSVVAGQGNPKLDQLDEKISSHLETALPGWSHKRVPAFGSSSNVLVQFWRSSENVNVKVAVSVRESIADAQKELRSFLQFRKEPQELPGFGDEAFAPESGGSDLVLRKGRYVIYLSMVAMPSDEGVEAPKSAVLRIGKEFARQFSLLKFE